MADSPVGRSAWWRRVWIAVRIGRSTWGWWPGDWRRSFGEMAPPSEKLTMGFLIGVSDD